MKESFKVNKSFNRPNLFFFSGTTRSKIIKESKKNIFNGLLLFFSETVLKCNEVSIIERKVNQNTPRNDTYII